MSQLSDVWEWSLDEHATLCRLLEQAPPQLTSVERCLRIAAHLHRKTARDVALRLRWMATTMKQQQQQQQDPPTGRVSKRPRSRRRGSRQSGFKISQAMKDSSSDGEEDSEGDGSSGPQLPKAPSMHTGATHTDASCTFPSSTKYQPWQAGKAGMGSGGYQHDPRALAEAGNSLISSLVEQNYSILASFRANMAQSKVAENTELLLRYRDNMMTALENMAAMPGVMSRMPALPVKPSLEAASRLLPPMKSGPRYLPFGACGMGPRCQCPQRFASNPPLTGMHSMQLMPPPPPPPHDLPAPPPFTCMPPPPFSSMDLPRPPVASLAPMSAPSCPLPPPVVDPPLPHAIATFPPFQPPQPLQAPVSMPLSGVSGAGASHSRPPPTLPLFPPGALPPPPPPFTCSLPLQQHLPTQDGGAPTTPGPLVPPQFPVHHHHPVPGIPPHAPAAQQGAMPPEATSQQQQQQRQQCSTHSRPCNSHQLPVHAPAALTQPATTALPASMACSMPGLVSQAPRSPLHAHAPGSPLHMQQQHQHPPMHGLQHQASYPPLSPLPFPQQQHASHQAAATHHHFMAQGVQVQGPYCPYPQALSTSYLEVFHPPGSPMPSEDSCFPPHPPAPGPGPFLPAMPAATAAVAAPPATAAPPPSPPVAAAGEGELQAAAEPILATAAQDGEPQAAAGPMPAPVKEEEGAWAAAGPMSVPAKPAVTGVDTHSMVPLDAANGALEPTSKQQAPPMEVPAALSQGQVGGPLLPAPAAHTQGQQLSAGPPASPLVDALMDPSACRDTNSSGQHHLLLRDAGEGGSSKGSLAGFEGAAAQGNGDSMSRPTDAPAAAVAGLPRGKSWVVPKLPQPVGPPPLLCVCDFMPEPDEHCPQRRLLLQQQHRYRHELQQQHLHSHELQQQPDFAALVQAQAMTVQKQLQTQHRHQLQHRPPQQHGNKQQQQQQQQQQLDGLSVEHVDLEAIGLDAGLEDELR